jgi:hypothetical protein
MPDGHPAIAGPKIHKTYRRDHMSTPTGVRVTQGSPFRFSQIVDLNENRESSKL